MALSEIDHYQSVVKRSNFIDLFLDEYNADAFIATHLYGAINNLSSVDNIPREELEDVLNTSAENLSGSFMRNVKRLDLQREKVKKLSPFGSYIALLKGYSVLSIMFLPKAFVDGGWLTSAIFLACSGIINCIGCAKLIDTGLATKLYSYPMIVEKVLG